jgi:glycosyltransferase involved in cell wall biosynthesis
MKFTVHCIVKNEERYLWYAVRSVASFAHKIIIWDTGSTDMTRSLLSALQDEYGDLISIHLYDSVTEQEYSDLRQAMIDQTSSKWILILDGDEVWWNSSLTLVSTYIDTHPVVESIVVPTLNLVGDMYHVLPESAGRYNLLGKKGHYNLRFFRKDIRGLHVVNPYGTEGFADENNILLQDRNADSVVFLDAPYLHATHLVRSSSRNIVMQRKKKMKYELGIPLSLDFYYPEAFFQSYPFYLANLWRTRTLSYLLRAFFETPMKILKRKVLYG